MGRNMIRNRFEMEGSVPDETHLNGTIQVLTSHESVRSFTPEEVAPAALEAILTSARSAPTSSNLQAYSIIVVRDADRKSRISALSGHQGFIQEAPLMLIFCADIHRLKYVTRRQGYDFKADTLEMFLLSSVDAALAMQNALVAAEALGYGAVPVGSVRNHPEELALELGLPEGMFAVVGLAVGREREGVRRGVKPRLPMSVTVHEERYSAAALDEGLKAYDEQMISRRSYDGRRVSIAGEPEKEGADYGWCEHTARRCTRPETIAPSSSLRENLREVLMRRGFSLR
ncbi:NADPH-dependent oxidoreductase [Paenibacillus cellulositrophicus]|uniref:NADPH-dependent oxidoreductase n=1 Tax=Paenibacillus cellulositrophicus TaxID=562959 RepID=UPI0012672744|nr:NADPH-dependent oxidoreductase [Paenibacillus cellulositrophicus]